MGTISTGPCPLSQAFLDSEQLAQLSKVDLSNSPSKLSCLKRSPFPFIPPLFKVALRRVQLMCGVAGGTSSPCFGLQTHKPKGRYWVGWA